MAIQTINNGEKGLQIRNKFNSNFNELKQGIDDLANGTAIQDGVILESKLTEDVQEKLNKGIVIESHVFTAIADNTTTFIIDSSIYTPNIDYIELIYEGEPLILNENYSMLGYQVTLGFPINIDSKINYNITKFITNMELPGADGALINNESIPLVKLTTDVQEKINSVPDIEQDIVNINLDLTNKQNAIGTLANLTTTEKTNLVGAVSEVNSQLAEKANYYDVISDMVSDINLKNGQKCVTLGYYSKGDNGGGLYYISNQVLTPDGCSVIALNNGLFATLIHNGKITLEQFGGKKNDHTFDNSPILYKCVQFFSSSTSHTGGTIDVGSGIFCFSTPINFTNEIARVKICGTSEEIRVIDFNTINNSTTIVGTQFIYNGSDYFITFGSGTHLLEICGIGFIGNGSNSCFNITYTGSYTNYKGKFHDLTFYQFAKSVRLNKSGYFYFERCDFTTSTTNGVCAVQLGDEVDYANTEYVYFDNCTFDGQTPSTGTAINIYYGQYIYFRECDIACWKGCTAVYIKPQTVNHRVYDIHFTNISFMLNSITFYLDVSVASIHDIDIIGCNFCTYNQSVDERFVKVVGGGTNRVFDMTLLDCTQDQANLTTVPTYGFELDGVTNFKINGWKGRTFGLTYSNSSYIEYNGANGKKSDTVWINAGTTTYTWTIPGTEYIPFANIPVFLICMNGYQFSYAVSRNGSNQIVVTITFSSATPSGCYMHYWLGNTKY